MAQAPQGQIRPSRYLFALGAIFLVLYGIVLGFGSGSFKERLEPKLGLDLIGGTTLTLEATTQDGNPPSPQNLQTARDIIENRVNAFGVAEAEVVTEGDSHIVISVPGENNDTVRQVGVPAQLRFRKVLKITSDLPSPVTASPSASASPDPSASASPTPAATTEPTTEPTATPAATTPAAAATPAPTNTPRPETEDVLAKLGDAAVIASQIQDPSTLTTDTATLSLLEPFRDLTPAEVAALPVQLQFNVPQVTCDKLNKRPAGSIENMAEPAVACEDSGNAKYLLDVAKAEGTDIDSAAANIDTTAGSQWKVDITFNSRGTERWSALTRETFNNEGGACDASSTAAKDDGSGQTCRLAVVLDNTIVSAPAVQSPQTSNSQITGGFNKASASLLSNQLKYGALPITFQQGELQSVSATLGADYLRAGLLAAGIGMLLVIAYSFFYYRLLGSVITLSLVLSALLTFGMLVLLGRTMGFTLTLAGIAGFIVSLGVAADSFVIYFERLKDEIRDGRAPRSAIQRAWIRARRTIITANAVTILAAVVLFILGVGSVKGFAFALGLATLLDLVIVFLFRHPMMMLLARTPAFLSPRVSGLGRVLDRPRDDSAGTGSTRTKEA